ncbi:MAG: amidohydrolase [Deltaproteobacteria bacterium]|nr:amidohydrolase [Deltaproteobacteria bacterium]
METHRLLPLLLCGFLLGGCVSGSGGADMVFLGGRIFTADLAGSQPEAVAIADGQIVFVGAAAEARALIRKGTEIVDLAGKMLLPGLQDSHTHPPLGVALEPLCRLDDARSNDEVLEAVQECAGSREDDWVLGFGWRSSIYLPEIAPSLADLDRIVPDRPAVLIAKDMHTFWLNSPAMRSVGITRDTPTPAGGEILRDPQSQEPLGILRDTATEMVIKVMPRPGMLAALKGLRDTIRRMNSYGYTSLMDARLDDPSVATGYRILELLGLLDARVSMAVLFDPRRDLSQLDEIEALRSDFSTDRLDAEVVKIFVDGGTSVRSAASSAYADGSPSSPVYIPAQDLNRSVVEIDRRGFSIQLHTLGDRATTLALDAIEAARRANPGEARRHAITHLVYPRPADLERFAELDVIANISPYWAFPNEWTASFFPSIGNERKAWMYPFRSLADLGVRLSAGSDYPFTPMNPFLAIEVGMTRKSPENGSSESLVPGEALTLEMLLVAYTRGAAYQNHREAETGSIEVGKAADLVVLDRDLFETLPEDISETRVQMTILEGEVVYRSGSQGQL